MFPIAIAFFLLFILCGWAAVQPQRALSLAGVDLRSLSKRERLSLESSWPLFLGLAAVACALIAAFCMHRRDIARREQPAIEAREAARQEKTRRYGAGSSYMQDSTARQAVEK